MAHDLDTGPVPRLVRAIALPAAVGYFFHTFFNIVDTFWAGSISTQAVAALSLSFPAFFVILSVGNGLSTGATALLATALGAGRQAEARRLAAQSLGLALAASLAVTGAGLAASPWMFARMGASGAYLDDCLAYMDPIFLGSVFFVLIAMLNGLLCARGETRPFRNFLVAGSLANAGLDPWFMSGGLGLPAMGLSGIAWATVLVQVAGTAYLARKVAATGLVGADLLRLARPRLADWLTIASQGVPAGLNMACVGLGIGIITVFLADFGQVPVAAYVIASRIEQVVLLPTMALNVATLALTAHNHGAGQPGRVRLAIRACLADGAWLMAAGGLLILALAPRLMALFTADLAVVAVGAGYLRIAAFVLYAYVILSTVVALMQGLKRPMFAVWMGLGRQIVAPLAVFWLLTEVFHGGVTALWWGIAGVVWSAALLALWVGRRALRELTREARAAPAGPKD
jgi:putative MATE family efflux protein